MNQILKIILILAIIIVGCTTDTEKSQEDIVDSEISQWSDYYKEIAEQCKEKPSSECCLAGLRDMVNNDYLLADENEECPEGFKQNMLLCLGSLVWCEPIEKPCAKEGETIGAQDMPESCCLGLKPMGGWPGGYQGDCSIPPPPTGLSICANCGNGICEIDNGENKCNCPEDCE